MPAPTLTHTGQRLYDALAPFAYDDEAQDWALAYYCQALASMVDEVADLSRDSEDDDPGYSGLFDLDPIAEDYLPHVGQFIGVQIPGHLTDEAKRLRIRETDGFKRGTVGAVKGAARQLLTGDKTVFLVERHGGPYRLTVTTYRDETPGDTFAEIATGYPDFDALEAAFDDFAELNAKSGLIETALRDQIPAGIVFEHRVIDPGTFDEFRDSHSDFDQVASVYVNFAEILLNPTKLWTYALLSANASTYAALALNYTDYGDLKTAS